MLAVLVWLAIAVRGCAAWAGVLMQVKDTNHARKADAVRDALLDPLLPAVVLVRPDREVHLQKDARQRRLVVRFRRDRC